MLHCIDKRVFSHQSARAADSPGGAGAYVRTLYRWMTATAFVLLANRALAG